MMLKFWEKDPPMVPYNICKNKENPRGQSSHLRISLYAMALKLNEKKAPLKNMVWREGAKTKIFAGGKGGYFK